MSAVEAEALRVVEKMLRRRTWTGAARASLAVDILIALVDLGWHSGDSTIKGLHRRATAAEARAEEAERLWRQARWLIEQVEEWPPEIAHHAEVFLRNTEGRLEGPA